jgi:hypothetical protein
MLQILGQMSVIGSDEGKIQHFGVINAGQSQNCGVHHVNEIGLKLF